MSIGVSLLVASYLVVGLVHATLVFMRVAKRAAFECRQEGYDVKHADMAAAFVIVTMLWPISMVICLREP